MNLDAMGMPIGATAFRRAILPLTVMLRKIIIISAYLRLPHSGRWAYLVETCPDEAIPHRSRTQFILGR